MVWYQIHPAIPVLILSRYPLICLFTLLSGTTATIRLFSSFPSHLFRDRKNASSLCKKAIWDIYSGASSLNTCYWNSWARTPMIEKGFAMECRLIHLVLDQLGRLYSGDIVFETKNHSPISPCEIMSTDLFTSITPTCRWLWYPPPSVTWTLAAYMWPEATKVESSSIGDVKLMFLDTVGSLNTLNFWGMFCTISRVTIHRKTG